VVGAAVALAGLAPSVPVDTTTHVALAVAGLVLGAGAAAWRRGSSVLVAGAVVVGVGVLGVVIAVVSTGHVASEIADARLSAASSDRAHEWTAALDVARHHLLLGTGAARVPLVWEVGGKIYTATFAHNEFLQLLAQDGVVGLGVLLVGLVAVFVSLWRRRGGDGAWSADCAVACLVALLVQSCLDFLWHIPVIPVLMAVVLALSTTPVVGVDGPVDAGAASRYAANEVSPEAGGGGDGTFSH
jgi:O-antigen ligase